MTMPSEFYGTKWTNISQACSMKSLSALGMKNPVLYNLNIGVLE